MANWKKEVKNMQEELQKIEDEINYCRIEYSKKNKELMHIESKMVEYKELSRSIKEKIEIKNRENDLISSRDDLRDAEIVRFKNALPELLKKIEDELPIEKVDILADRT